MQCLWFIHFSVWLNHCNLFIAKLTYWMNLPLSVYPLPIGWIFGLLLFFSQNDKSIMNVHALPFWEWSSWVTWHLCKSQRLIKITYFCFWEWHVSIQWNMIISSVCSPHEEELLMHLQKLWCPHSLTSNAESRRGLYSSMQF